jgi:GR25 family glycosyltransferase involved in LPS biosynthesis
MKKPSRLLIHFLKLANFTYFEITIKDRLRLFIKHLINKLTKNIRFVDTQEISITKTYIISLNFRLDRRQSIQKQLSNIPLELLFVDGIIYDSSKAYNNDFTKKSLRYMSHGAIGCAISHIQLWKKIAAEEIEKYYLILEDDVIFDSNFSKSLTSALKHYPINADIFFLGSRNERPRDISFFTNFNYCGSFNSRLGAFAYIISGKSARKILNTVLPINLLCGGIDTSLGIAIRKNEINAYQMYPSIIYHDNTSLSNIHNPSANRKKLHGLTVTTWPN